MPAPPPSTTCNWRAARDPLTDLIANTVLKPLNAKFGKVCFNLGATSGEQVTVTFEPACSDKSVLTRLDS